MTTSNQAQRTLIIRGLSVDSNLCATPYNGYVPPLKVPLANATYNGICQLAQIEPLSYQNENRGFLFRHGAAGSWQMENRTVTMSQGKFDFGFAIDWMHKDLSICLNDANKMGVELPQTENVDSKYQLLQQQGFGRMDTSVLFKIYDR